MGKGDASQEERRQEAGGRRQKLRETKTILLTSFDVWKSCHTSNASDDLLEEMLSRDKLGKNVYLLRKVPVDFELAPEKVIAEMNRTQPDIVVCCGMAEKRKLLSIESNGKFKDDVIHTKIDVRQLVQKLSITRVSHNAGKFVQIISSRLELPLMVMG